MISESHIPGEPHDESGWPDLVRCVACGHLLSTEGRESQFAGRYCTKAKVSA